MYFGVIYDAAFFFHQFHYSCFEPSIPPTWTRAHTYTRQCSTFLPMYLSMLLHWVAPVSPGAPFRPWPVARSVFWGLHHSLSSQQRKVFDVQGLSTFPATISVTHTFPSFRLACASVFSLRCRIYFKWSTGTSKQEAKFGACSYSLLKYPQGGSNSKPLTPFFDIGMTTQRFDTF